MLRGMPHAPLRSSRRSSSRATHSLALSGPLLALAVAAGCGGDDASGTPPDATSAGWTQIAAGGDHACGVAMDGSLWCWGASDSGQLGNGDMMSTSTPRQVSGLTGVTSVAAGWKHTCAVDGSGQAWCWGFNDLQQLGNGTADPSASPVMVSGLSDATAIACGDAHSCAIRADKTVWCWGLNVDGQLGHGMLNVDSAVPVQVAGLAGATSIAASFATSCATTMDGAAHCWGENLSGQLGPAGSGDASDVPVAITGVSGAVQIAAGDGHSCVVTSGNEVWCWGENGKGQLGDGTQVERTAPAKVPGVTATTVAASINHTCAAGTNGVSCWGGNLDDMGMFAGKLGDGSTEMQRLTPTPVTGLSAASALTTGDQLTCAISAGDAYCWGKNDDGELGDGTTTPSSSPVRVAAP